MTVINDIMHERLFCQIIGGENSLVVFDDIQDNFHFRDLVVHITSNTLYLNFRKIYWHNEL